MNPDDDTPVFTEQMVEGVLESTTAAFPPLSVNVDFIDLYDKFDGDLERVYTVLGDLKDLLS